MKHKHKWDESIPSKDYCYDHCVAGENCNPASHGNITYSEHCKCGAYRKVNSNYGRQEYGPWIKKTEE